MAVDRRLDAQRANPGVIGRLALAGFSNDEKMAAVQYLKFPIDERMRAAFADADSEVRLTADNRRYRGEAEVTPLMRQEWLRDLDRSALK